MTRVRRVAFALIPTLVVLALLEAAARVYERADRARRGAAELLLRPELARRGDETLVYVYGESTVAGAPVPEIGFVRQMEFFAARRSAGKSVRFVNLGKPGLDSAGVRAAFEATVGNRPDLAVVLCGNNEFLRPGVSDDQTAGGLALVRVPATLFARAFPEIRRRRSAGALAKPVDRASDEFRRKEELYFENMTALARAAKEAGTPLLLGTLPCNLRDWPPVFRRMERPGDDPSYEATMEEALAGARRGDAASLNRIVDEKRTRFADDAMFRFLRGRLRLLEGDERGARQDLIFARDADPVPLRATSRFDDFVRTLARDEGALFCDVEAEVAGGGIPGFDVMADNCHPGPEGSRRVARALLTAAERAGILPASTPRAETAAEFLAAAGFTPGSPLDLRFLLQTGRYAMQRPFLDMTLAGRHFEDAVARHPSSWEARANLATVRLIQGRREEGLALVREATELFGRPLDVEDREATPYLKEALEAAGR